MLGIGAFTDPAAPGWSKVVVAIAIALTIAGVALTAVKGQQSATPAQLVQSGR